MAARHRVITLLSLVVLATFISRGQAAAFCNPVVEPTSSDTTLIRALSRIADEYQFQLTIPVSLDRPIRFDKKMTLERLVKHLTRNMNTVSRHKKVDDCATPILTSLIVLEAGREAGIVSEQPSPQEQTVDYIYIDNMEQYVTNVLAGKQQADLERMTPEQREEFGMVREMLTNKPVYETSETEQPANSEASDTNNSNQAPGAATGN